MAPIEVEFFADLESASDALGRALVEAAARALSRQNRFSLALAGGRTPTSLYRRLASRHRTDIPWERVHLFWSDERYVPANDRASNLGSARATLLEGLTVPADQIHAPDTSLGDPAETARRYEAELLAHGPLDVVLLGLGEDGHIASLFPHSRQLEETSRLVLPVWNSPKPPSERITMTLPAFAQARRTHVLVSGEKKREALSRAMAGQPDEPVSRARQLGVAISIWADRNAAPLDTQQGVEFTTPGEEPK